MQRAWLSLLILCIYNFFCFSQNNTSITNFQKNINLENASIGICIEDMDGKEIASLNKKQSLTPASILKVVTTATILEILGKDHQFKTEIAIDSALKNKLIIRGYGDPTLGSNCTNPPLTDFMNEWATQIRNNVKTPVQTLEIDDSYFGYNGVSPKWIREDMGNYYAAGCYGISIFDNTYKLFLNTMDKDLPPKVVKTEPNMPELIFTNMMGTNKYGKDNGYILGEPFSNNRLLIGDIPLGKTTFSIKGDIPDPGLYLGEILSRILSSNGKVYTTRTDFLQGKYQTNLSAKIIYTHLSPPLSDIIRIVNVWSNNHYAEHLIRQIGKTTNRVSDITPYYDALGEGIVQVKDFWESKGIATDGLFMYDGCGLAPSNAVNPALMCNILRYMYKQSRQTETFLESFPKAGKDGTVRNLLRKTKLEGKVLVKSGSIANVQCYAGYYIEGDKKYVFTIMVNNFKSNSRREVVKAIEKLLLDILN